MRVLICRRHEVGGISYLATMLNEAQESALLRTIVPTRLVALMKHCRVDIHEHVLWDFVTFRCPYQVAIGHALGGCNGGSIHNPRCYRQHCIIFVSFSI